ncbi:hypothetical protein DV515_00010482 [Chloebia gouldiae]|uniref:Uncharacterized protein n=1 Tax=Chloebia gouldiae TaxID=44316 RepID=A0A3L8S9A6_CHLGU|nr:hypothetical protein DV515_00010482 [Chloebia gouldiae]
MQNRSGTLQPPSRAETGRTWLGSRRVGTSGHHQDISEREHGEEVWQLILANEGPALQGQSRSSRMRAGSLGAAPGSCES